jgi:hypothetical protein
MRLNGVLFCAAALSRLAAAQVSPSAVPVDQEPQHHLLFANESLRIIAPQLQPGYTTLEHAHSHDDASVCIHGSQVRGKLASGEWGNPGMICTPGAIGMTEYTGKARSHTVQNVGTGVYHLVLVENLRDSGWTAPAPPIDGMKVLRENRSFRVYEGQAGVHSHDVPTVVVLVSGKVSVGAKSLDQPGAWAVVPAGEKHQVTAEAGARYVEIEVR